MTEFDLIFQYFDQHSKVATDNLHFTDVSVNVVKGIGDDAAVINVLANSHATQLVTCVDTLVQGRHFAESWTQVEALAFAIGYKSVAVNVSDLAAMGAAPHSILLALALPKRLAKASWLDEFAKGVFHACSQFDMTLIGGDTTRHDKLVISVTANGVMSPNSVPVYRHGAQFDGQVGDKVYVSGTLGDACYALNYPTTDIGQQLAHRLHMPTPRLALAKMLAQRGIATAMIDVSDGLVQDVGHIARQSGVTIRLDIDQLPTSEPLQGAKLTERLQCQLAGGDDYELVFTVSADANLPDAINVGNTPVKCIGEVVGVVQKVPNTTESTYVQLSYQGNLITKKSHYPFECMPSLKGFMHF